MRKPNAICEYCQNPMYLRPNDRQRYNTHTCSLDCRSRLVGPNGRAVIPCPVCGKEFKQNRSKTKHCSRACANTGRTGIKYDGTRIYCLVNKSQKLRRIVIERDGEYCLWCRLGPIWENKPIVLQVDHIDGNKSNNDQSNLRLLCPNCHSQTDTFGSRNIKKHGSTSRILDDGITLEK